MPSLASIALLAGATLSLAAPTQHHGQKVRVHQVAGSKPCQRSGPIAMMKMYNKYSHMKAPAGLKEAAAAAAADRGSVTTKPKDSHDSEYLYKITVGDDTMNMNFDTGSSDLWVFADVTPREESTGHNLYNTSSGILKQDYTWDITYEDKTGASGTIYVDKVVIGGVTATSQAVEAATSASQGLIDDTTVDGLVGLAFKNGNTAKPKKQSTFFDNVKADLESELFTLDLKHNKAGSYDFGYIDDAKYSGDINYVDVDTSDDSWLFTAGGYSAYDNATSGSIGTTIADTGTALLLVPESVASDYYDNVDSASYSKKHEGYTFNCDEDMPDFNIEIGSVTYTVPGEYINWNKESDGTCYGGIQGVDNGDGNVFGDVFLKSVFVVFDQTKDTPRLGFAKKA